MIMVGYGRVSTCSDEQIDSLEHQRAFFTDFANAHNHKLYHIYCDTGISGKQLKNREQFKKMLGDAKSGLFDLVVVKDVSRFARNTVDLLTAVRALKSQGIEVLFISNNQKILGESEFVLTLFGAMAQEESANLSKRVKFGKRITAGRGRVPTRVFGYDRVDNYTLTINEDEAAVVRAIFAHYLSGLGCRRIANELNSRGAKTKLGCDWDARGVRRILENSIYCGRYVNRKFEVTDFIEGTLKKLPTDENLLHLRPEWAIVSADTFSQATETRAARANLYKNANPYTGGRHSTRHMFSTIIHCAHCGRSFTRKSGEFWKCTTNDQRGSRICDNNTAVDERQLAQALSDFLSNIIGDRSELSARVSAKMQAAVTCDSSVADERARARQVRASARYREMFAAELISMDELKKALSKIEQNLVQLTPKPNPPSFNADAAIDDFFEMTNVENIDIRRLVQKICVSRKREAEIFIGE